MCGVWNAEKCGESGVTDQIVPLEQIAQEIIMNVGVK